MELNRQLNQFINEFTNDSNDMNNKIKFTTEKRYNPIHFLDLTIQLIKRNKIQYEIYIQPTHVNS